MNITAFLNYLNKTRGWAIDADYYGYIADRCMEVLV